MMFIQDVAFQDFGSQDEIGSQNMWDLQFGRLAMI
jgi:hypothetical protein